MLLAERFAKHALETRYKDLTEDAINQAKVFILDTLGVGISGSTAFGADKLLKVFGQDGSKESTIWGTTEKASATAAALVNGFQIHCQEYDCVHEGAVLHPMATTLPAVTAMAEKLGGVTGKDFITACAVGVNISAGLGIASRSGLTFFRPATAGGFGATAAVGRLMGLSEEQLVQALGLQYAQTSGTLQPHVEGVASLPFQVGVNARAAVHSCELAKAGFQGAKDIFEGPYGYFKLMEAPNQCDLTETYKVLDRKRWLISETSHKPYPAGRATHGGVEGLQILRQNKDGSVVKPEEIKDVVITGPPVTARLCARPDLPNPSPNYARLCMPYVAAKVLLNGFIDLAHYRGSELTHKPTHELANRISMVSDGQEDPNALLPISMVVNLTNGESRTWKCEQMLASPSRRLTREQHLTKFYRCWEFAADTLSTKARDDLIKLVDVLETVTDAQAIASLVRAEQGSKPMARSKL